MWHAKRRVGIQRFNELDAVIGDELITRDCEGAQAFHAPVFGYAYSKIDDEALEHAIVEGGGVLDRQPGPAAADRFGADAPALALPPFSVHESISPRSTAR